MTTKKQKHLSFDVGWCLPSIKNSSLNIHVAAAQITQIVAAEISVAPAWFSVPTLQSEMDMENYMFSWNP